MKHKMRRNRSFEFKNNEGKIENEERGKRKIMSMMIRNDVSNASSARHVYEVWVFRPKKIDGCASIAMFKYIIRQFS